MAANVVFPPGGANSTTPNPLAVFEGSEEAEKERGKGRKGGEKGRKRREKLPSPSK